MRALWLCPTDTRRIPGTDASWSKAAGPGFAQATFVPSPIARRPSQHSSPSYQSHVSIPPVSSSPRCLPALTPRSSALASSSLQLAPDPLSAMPASLSRPCIGSRRARRDTPVYEAGSARSPRLQPLSVVPSPAAAPSNPLLDLIPRSKSINLRMIASKSEDAHSEQSEPSPASTALALTPLSPHSFTFAFTDTSSGSRSRAFHV